jgi:hypothetical protein
VARILVKSSRVRALSRSAVERLIHEPSGMTGRTSTAPPHAAGTCAAQASASSRSAQSSR